MILVKKIQDEQKIEELKSLRHQLNHLVKNCHGDERPDCPILDDLSSI